LCDAQAAASVGATLAAIGRRRYPRAGRLEAGGKLGAPFVPGPDRSPMFDLGHFLR
jgi:hypothetical protein